MSMNAQEGQGLQLVSIEVTRNADALVVHDHTLRPAQQHLFGHCGCLVAQEVPSAIQHQDLSLRHLWQLLGKALLYCFNKSQDSDRE